MGDLVGSWEFYQAVCRALGTRSPERDLRAVRSEESSSMKTIDCIDCTPPPDLPDVVIVLDPKYGFWIRVANESGGSDCPHEGYFATLPGARAEARKLGFEPEAWVGKDGIVMRF